MSLPRDRLDLSARCSLGATPPRPDDAAPRLARPPKKFLQIWYRCCHTYGRLTRNAEGTAFVGRCPRCGARCEALIGEGGSSRRSFEAG